MVDCGEGTQVQLRRLRIGFTRIQSVFISHLHGDHCFGLIGLISTFGMLGRTSPLHVYAPGEFEPMLRSQMEMFCQGLEYKVVFHPVDTTQSQVVYEDKSLTVITLPLEHRVACCGYLFRERPTLPHIRRDMIDFYHIPVCQINNIKNGTDWVTPEGEVISHERLTVAAEKPRAYAYCSDTRYVPTLHRLVEGWMCCITNQPMIAAMRLAPACFTIPRRDKRRKWPEMLMLTDWCLDITAHAMKMREFYSRRPRRSSPM